ncbi:MAG: tetratricopeptide repeat protein [Acidobacteriota bacterium]
MESIMRVLVVDDQASMRGVIKKMLHQLGYFQGMEEAADGEEAWRKLKAQVFDFVICDMGMPVLDGIGLLKRCRADVDLRDIPFLMISGDSMAEVVAHAGEWGAYDYLVKPFSFTGLKQRIDVILDRMKSPEEALFREVERMKDDGYAREALEKIEKVEKILPRRPKWMNLKGECLMELDEMDRAAEMIEQALDNSEKFLTAYKNYAIIQQKLGNTEKAIEALEMADRLSPMEPDRKLTLGKLMIKTGRGEEGTEFLEAALKQSDRQEKDAYRLKVAEVYLENDMFSEAEKHYVRVLKTNPQESIEAYNRLGIALRRQGKFKEAEKYYLMALKVYPDNAAIYYNLGVLFMNREQFDSASQYFKKAIQLEPDFKEAREKLDTLVRMVQGKAKAS